ncbi:C-type lectin lectoxin-Enh4-like [Epinephelus lanceolatus]
MRPGHLRGVQASPTGFSISSCSHFPLREYHYVNEPMTWAAAQRYCRTKYTDLATIESMDDIDRLQPTFSYSWAWIGLIDDPISWKGTMGSDTNSWRWSATEINQTDKTYVFISARRTWADARDYCREHHTDLPMMESNEENNKVYSTKPAGAGAWIGLYRVPWTWSDKTQSSFRSWQSAVPNNARGDEFCVIENTNHEWDDDYCWKEYPFICHQVLKLKTTVKLTFKTDADITDPAANTQILQQLGAMLTSQGWTNFKLGWKMEPRKQEKEN